jgi:hypothetical protein
MTGITDSPKRAASGGIPLPDLTDLPARVTREDAAALLTRYFFKTSPRTLERAPLPWRRLNGKAHVETAELFRFAASILDEAPTIMGGRRETKRAA